MHKIYLALGSNVGDKKKNILMAIDALGEQITLITTAKIYASKAAYVTDQDDFYNTAISGQTQLSPEDLLIFVKEIEKKIWRISRAHRWPREIDIDILLYDDIILDSETLKIPHPRIAERDFVLQPLLDIEPDLIHPQLQETMQKLYEKIPQENRFITQNIG